MSTTIAVNIYNWNCLEKGLNMVLDVNDGLLVINTLGTSPNQVWNLLPNLVTGGAGGGYTIFNQGTNQSVEQPTVQHQIVLGDDPTPYGSAGYCWTLWPAGESSNTMLWAIQDAERGPTMDVWESGTDNNTAVMFWGWNGGDNQRWVIKPV